MQQRLIRKGGAVKRWHTIETITEQTVAAHSWGVACVCLDIWPDCSRSLITAALHHDVPEARVGDVPAPVKWEYPSLKKELDKVEDAEAEAIGISYKLNESDKVKLKIADMMELLWFCIDEERLGNRNMKEVFVRGVKYLQDIELDIPATEMLNYLIATEADL